MHQSYSSLQHRDHINCCEHSI